MFSFLEAARELKGSLEFPDDSIAFHEASLDTRILQRGDLFVALSGTHYNGHAFLKEAFRKGASGALIDKKYFAAHPDFFQDPDIRFRNLLAVENPEAAFSKLAAWYRAQFPIPAVGITGSVGKTSTKEFLSFILSNFRPTLATAGNKNNHLGLPLTLLRLKKDHEFIAAELGANHPGEIRFLSNILKPVCGILTQIAPVHLEGFGNLEKIYETKLEILEVLPKEGVAILPDHDAILKIKAEALGKKMVFVGQTHQANRRVAGIYVQNGHVHFQYEGRHFAFPALAPFWAQNAALALAAAQSLGLDLGSLPEVWKDFKLPEGRFEPRRLADGIQIIFDGYNSNPLSFQSVLEAFQGIESAGRKVLVFSDMLELGTEEEAYHAKLGEWIASSSLAAAFAYGPRSQTTIRALKSQTSKINYCHFSGPEEVAYYLSGWLAFGDTVLFKASRGMKIEQVMDRLEEILAQKSEVAN